MYIKEWYYSRGSNFVFQRGSHILYRYGITSRKACRRIDALVAALADQECFPTFPSPGILARNNPQFLAHLQNAGVEIAIHGYQHLSLNSLPLGEAIRQLEKAVHLFERQGLKASGFRCPYMSYTDELLDRLPKYFDYSSNCKFWWNGLHCGFDEKGGSFSRTLQLLYAASHSNKAAVSVPWMRRNMIEIPVTLPDDLFLHDGLKLDSHRMALAWMAILRDIHCRGELFTLLFHTELADVCKDAISELLRDTRQLRPEVWIARLRDIADWWKEKSHFAVQIVDEPPRLRTVFACSDRATILGRNIHLMAANDIWDKSYSRLKGRTFDLPSLPRPFVGLPHSASPAILTFLTEQGYIVETDERATHCGTYIDECTLAGLTNQVQLIDHIENSGAPLIRFWRWPNGFKSALAVTGDLDALNVMDYASRLPFLKWL